MGLVLVLPGCASTPEFSSTQALKTEDPVCPRAQAGSGTCSRAHLPELNEASGLNDFLAYAALKNPQLEAAFNRWKAALEMVSQARTLPDPRFTYGYFIQEVETRVGPQEQQVGLSQMFPWFGKLKLQGEATLGGANAAQQQYETDRDLLFDARAVINVVRETASTNRAAIIENARVRLNRNDLTNRWLH